MSAGIKPNYLSTISKPQNFTIQKKEGHIWKIDIIGKVSKPIKNSSI